LIAALLYALALLTKSYNLFFAPLFAYLFWWKDGFQVLKKKSPYLFFLVAFSFFGGWWWWIGKHPEGLPYSSWLLNEGNIRFKGAWFYWLFAERMGKLILGYWGLVLLGIGLVLQAKKEKYFFHLWFLGQIAFMAVFAKGNVTHDYYQYLFLPFGVVFLAKGSRWLLTVPGKHFSRILSAGLFFLCLLFGVAFSWYFVRDFYNLQGGVDLAGKAVDQLVPSGALVVAGDGADPTLLYNTNRTGWTIGFGSTLENTPAVLQKLIDEEADYYVTTKIDALQGSGFGDYLKHNFNVIKETDQFIIYSLQPK